jgi:hypothetical protein
VKHPLLVCEMIGRATRHIFVDVEPVELRGPHGEPFAARALIYECQETGHRRRWGYLGGAG